MVAVSENDDDLGRCHSSTVCSSSRAEEEFKPGSFLKRLLTSGTEKQEDGEKSQKRGKAMLWTAEMDESDEEKEDREKQVTQRADSDGSVKPERCCQSKEGIGHSRSRTRSRSRSRKSNSGKRMLRSVSPLPKKMPRPFPKAPKTCPNPKIFLKPKTRSHAASLKPISKASVVSSKVPQSAHTPNIAGLLASHNDLHTHPRPSSAPTSTPTSAPISVPISAPKHLATSSSPKISAENEDQAMKILARHSARLGPLGTKLENAVREIISVAGRSSVRDAVGNYTRRWDFLDRKDGLARYQNLRKCFTETYNKNRLCIDADREVLAQLHIGESSHSSSSYKTAVPPPAKHAAPGQRLRLPVSDVRFAHNDQSERFGNIRAYNDTSNGSILQLTTELLAGRTDPANVPTFNVCWFEGHWYCRTGNRRLAAFRLAHLLAPKCFRDINVYVAPTDTVFFRGAPGKRPKLTTNLNGAHCLGRWLVIRETGEVVGHGKPDHAQYGVDLLALLPVAACVASRDSELEEDE